MEILKQTTYHISSAALLYMGTALTFGVGLVSGAKIALKITDIYYRKYGHLEKIDPPRNYEWKTLALCIGAGTIVGVTSASVVCFKGYKYLFK